MRGGCPQGEARADKIIFYCGAIKTGPDVLSKSPSGPIFCFHQEAPASAQSFMIAFTAFAVVVAGISS